MFSKLTGLSQTQLKEGFHFKIPYFQTPIIYNIQTRPITIKGVTANKDMQNVNLALRGKYLTFYSFLSILLFSLYFTKFHLILLKFT